MRCVFKCLRRIDNDDVNVSMEIFKLFVPVLNVITVSHTKEHQKCELLLPFPLQSFHFMKSDENAYVQSV